MRYSCDNRFQNAPFGNRSRAAGEAGDSRGGARFGEPLDGSRGEGIACADRIRDFDLNALGLYELTVGKHRATVLAECDAHGSPTETRACLPAERFERFWKVQVLDDARRFGFVQLYDLRGGQE